MKYSTFRFKITKRLHTKLQLLAANSRVSVHRLLVERLKTIISVKATGSGQKKEVLSSGVSLAVNLPSEFYGDSIKPVAKKDGLTISAFISVAAEMVELRDHYYGRAKEGEVTTKKTFSGKPEKIMSDVFTELAKIATMASWFGLYVMNVTVPQITERTTVITVSVTLSGYPF